LAGFRVAAGDEHVGAVGHEATSNHEADAAPAACDEHLLPLDSKKVCCLERLHIALSLKAVLKGAEERQEEP
jgi:hypothetical protein